MLLYPRRLDTTQCGVGPSKPEFTASSKLVSDLELISLTRATVPDTMPSRVDTGLRKGATLAQAAVGAQTRTLIAARRTDGHNGERIHVRSTPFKQY